MKQVNRAGVAFAVVVALGGILAACGSNTPAAGTSKVSLEGSEFAFAPNALEATAGQYLEVTLVNKGTLEHDFTIDSLGVKLLAPVGQSPSAKSDKTVPAGTYEFYCSVAGHKEAGMTGTIVVK